MFVALINAYFCAPQIFVSKRCVSCGNAAMQASITPTVQTASLKVISRTEETWAPVSSHMGWSPESNRDGILWRHWSSSWEIRKDVSKGHEMSKFKRVIIFVNSLTVESNIEVKFQDIQSFEGKVSFSLPVIYLDRAKLEFSRHMWEELELSRSWSFSTQNSSIFPRPRVICHWNQRLFQWF